MTNNSTSLVITGDLQRWLDGMNADHLSGQGFERWKKETFYLSVSDNQWVLVSVAPITTISEAQRSVDMLQRFIQVMS